MPKVSVTLEFANAQEAIAFLSSSAGGGATASTTHSPSSAPTVTTGGPPPAPAGNAPPVTPAPPAATPPASAPPMSAPAPASAPPPAPPAAPASAPASSLHTETLQAMSAYGKSPHKAAGIKRILARVGLTAVKADTPPETMNWLKVVFSPKADGTFYTPEEVEAM